MYGFSTINHLPLGPVLFALGVAGLLFFARWEGRVPSPIFNMDLFRENRVFLFSNIAALITYLSTFAVTFLLSLYLQYIKDLSPQRAGEVLLASSALMAIFTPVSGRISDKIEPRLVAGVGMALNCVALAMFIFLGSGTPLWYVIVALAFYGMGIGIFASPNSNAIMGAVEQRVLSVASGTLGTMRTAGMMLSMGIMMVLFSLYIGDAEITPARYPDFLMSVRTGFIIFTALSAGGLAIQITARRRSAVPTR